MMQWSSTYKSSLGLLIFISCAVCRLNWESKILRLYGVIMYFGISNSATAEHIEVSKLII